MHDRYNPELARKHSKKKLKKAVKNSSMSDVLQMDVDELMQKAAAAVEKQ